MIYPHEKKEPEVKEPEEKEEDGEGIKFNDGYCWACGKPVSVWATGCPHCHRSFVD